MYIGLPTPHTLHKKKAGLPFLGGVRWRPGLPINQIILPRRTRVGASPTPMQMGAQEGVQRRSWWRRVFGG